VSVFVLAAKTAVAVVLLTAGGAKLADLAGFASTIRLFLPVWLPARLPAVARPAAFAIAAAELLAGAVSLCWPALTWVNVGVLALSAGVVIAAGLGYARHRGQPCHCFGALTSRGFGLAGLVRAMAIAAAAAVACVPLRPAPQLHFAPAFHVLLLAGSVLLAAAAAAAAKALLAQPGSTGTAA
jgi:hypothetical protein